MAKNGQTNGTSDNLNGPWENWGQFYKAYVKSGARNGPLGPTYRHFLSQPVKKVTAK